jgi:hypothetical protein
MTELIDRADVEHVLRDPRYLVPEADAAAARPMARFRSRASRFANGPTHELRRARLEELLELLDPHELAAAVAARTRAQIAVSSHADGASDDGPGVTAAEVVAPDVAAIARCVPVAALAERLGFDRPDDMPPLVAVVAAPYATGADSDAADVAITRLLEAAPQRPAVATQAPDSLDRRSGDGLDDAALRVQLLVQAFAATAALVEGAVLRAVTSPAAATEELLAVTLRDDPPVRLTRRVDPDGEVVAVRLDGPDRDERTGGAVRSLAFGAGRRACPAERLAVAMAGAIIEELRAC